MLNQNCFELLLISWLTRYLLAKGVFLWSCKWSSRLFYLSADHISFICSKKLWSKKFQKKTLHKTLHAPGIGCHALLAQYPTLLKHAKSHKWNTHTNNWSDIMQKMRLQNDSMSHKQNMYMNDKTWHERWEFRTILWQ
jgi:hypothetical protein